MSRGAVRVLSPTEAANPRTAHIDEVPTAELVRLINDEDRLVADAVARALPGLARLVDEAGRRGSAGGRGPHLCAGTARGGGGGRAHYFGAGTSGGLAAADAAELPPTFGVAPDEVVVAHQAGGSGAVQQAVEGAEDDDAGVDAAGVTAADVVVGIAASGRTPYVGAALSAGRAAGAATALVTSNPHTPFADRCDFLLVPE